MLSPRRAERGGWRVSAAFVVLVSGIAGAFIFGPLLQLKWFEGELPFSPYKVQPTAAKSYVTRKVDISEGYSFTWVERKSARRAPALALRVTPLDLSGWWSRDFTAKQLGEAGDGPEMLHLYVLVPGADGFAPDTPICTEGERAFAGCRMAQADVILRRDDGDWTKHDILLGRRTPEPTDAIPLKDRSLRVLREFWSSREPGGRLRFRGWDCSAEQLAAERRELGPLPKAEASLAEHLRCFQPPRAWERWMPSRFGYDKQAVLFECQPKGTACHAYFLFHYRFTDVRFLWLPGGEDAEQLREQLRIRTFLTAWQMLNRLHEEARQPSGPAGYLAEARVQTDVCIALARELQSWGRDSQRGGWTSPMLPCRRAGAIVTRFAKDAPQEVLPMLAQLIETMRRTEGRDSEWERLVEARIVALEAAGRRDSPEMLHLLASFYGDTSYSKESKDFARHGEAMKQGWELARKFGAQATEDRERMHHALVRHYSTEGNHQAVTRAYDELLADIARDSGPQSVRLAKPLQRLAHFYWQQGDFPSLRRTADRLRGIYLARSENLAAAADNFEERRLEQQIGFDLVFLYRNYAFNQLAHAEVVPLAREVTARMERTLGPANPYLKAARFHQHEISSGKAAPNGTPIGGGLLPKIW
jgi:hypothetical protein